MSMPPVEVGPNAAMNGLGEGGTVVSAFPFSHSLVVMNGRRCEHRRLCLDGQPSP